MTEFFTENIEFLVHTIFYGLGFGFVVAFVRPVIDWFKSY